MSKTALMAAFLIAAFAPNALAQAPSPAEKAKKQACQAQAKAKNLVEKPQRKAFMDECMKK